MIRIRFVSLSLSAPKLLRISGEAGDGTGNRGCDFFS